MLLEPGRNRLREALCEIRSTVPSLLRLPTITSRCRDGNSLAWPRSRQINHCEAFVLQLNLNRVGSCYVGRNSKEPVCLPMRGVELRSWTPPVAVASYVPELRWARPSTCLDDTAERWGILSGGVGARWGLTCMSGLLLTASYASGV